MPETMAQRLQAVIADEAAQRAAGTAAPALLVPGRPDLPDRAGHQARRPSARVWSSPLLLRGLAAAGVLVLLVGGGILLANQRGVGTSSSTGGPAARPAKSRPSVGAVGSPAATMLRYQHGGHYVYTNAVASDVNYTKASLPAGVRHEVNMSAQLVAPSPNVAPVSGASTPRRTLGHTTVGQLESCLATVAPSGPSLVQLVAVARYLGRPATIIVFTPVDNAFDVIVVGEACGPSGEDVLARLVVPRK